MKNILALISPPNFDDEEKNRVAGILNVIALSVLAGFLVLFLPKLVLGQFQFFAEILMAGGLIGLSIIFLRLGRLFWAENVLLSTLLGFIVFMLFSYNGMHSLALLGIPICLVFAGISLKTKSFYAFTLLTVFSVAVVGILEITGKLVNPFSHFTTYLDVIDITVIVAATAFAVRTLAVNIFRNMHTAIRSEHEIRQQTEILRESEEKFRTLTEELPNLVYILKNNRIVYANEKCKELIGFLREELYSADFDILTVIAPEYRDAFVQRNQQLMNGEDVESFECAFLSKGDDRIRCFHMSKIIRYEGEPAILSLVTDLTEVNRAQEAIRESEMRLSSIIVSAMEAIITLDEQKSVRSFNPAAEQMFRCLQQEAIGQSIERFITFPQLKMEHVQTNETDIRSLVDVMEGKVQLINGIRVNGETFPAEVSISKTNIDHEAVYTIILRDITERMKSEERQRDLQAQLLQSQKMEAVGALAGGIAHDFNNLLSIIIGNAELVKLKLDAEHPAARNIDEVLSGSERAQELVHQILAFSRKQDSKLRPIRLHYILREGMKLLRASIPTTIDIKLELPQNGPLVLGDPTQLHQVLMNLCTNAAYAMQGMNGKLNVRQRNIDFDDRAVLFHPDLHSGQYAMFTIQDNGCGMDGFTVKRIFEPFFTTKEPGKGTGLGLSIAHSIVKSHGGAIKVKSEQGKGTQVDVYIPMFHGEEESVPVEQVQEKKGRAEKILIIDDEKPLLHTLTEILKGLGYTPMPFTSSIEALQVFEQNPLSYDMVITDQTMPQMTGTLLAHRIGLIRSDIPIILMTGYDQLEDPEKLKKLGIRTVMLKPFKKSLLAETIKKVFKERVKVS